jgi:Fe-Mn family superoxide dismutase
MTDTKQAASAEGHFTLPPLPYPVDALAPHVSADALGYHHDKHHAGYVKKVNELLGGRRNEGRSLEDVVRESDGPLFDAAAQHWNHSFFWHCLSPKGGGQPPKSLDALLTKQWKSVDGFKKELEGAAMTVFGSGWTWLISQGGQLSIVNTHDAGTPIVGGARPLLALDMWEHAFYIDHRAEKKDWLAAYWKVVDWDFAARNLESPWTAGSR